MPIVKLPHWIFHLHFSFLFFSNQGRTIIILYLFFFQKLAKITAAVATALYQLANDGQASNFEINVDNETKAIVSTVYWSLIQELFSVDL